MVRLSQLTPCYPSNARHMRRIFNSAALAGAFCLGAASMHLLSRPAHAEPLPLRPLVIDLQALSAGALPAPEPGPNGHLRTKAFVDEPGAVVRIQVGTVPKHYHIVSNEIQYVITGTGSEWLGARRVAQRPEIFFIAPKGTIHGGTTVSRVP
jgi:mannose-6-phosphate isomerase-like protein (cupin superfamily)